MNVSAPLAALLIGAIAAPLSAQGTTDNGNFTFTMNGAAITGKAVLCSSADASEYTLLFVQALPGNRPGGQLMLSIPGAPAVATKTFPIPQSMSMWEGDRGGMAAVSAGTLTVSALGASGMKGSIDLTAIDRRAATEVKLVGAFTTAPDRCEAERKAKK